MSISPVEQPTKMSALEQRLEQLSPEKRELVLMQLRKKKAKSATENGQQGPAIQPVPRAGEIPLSFSQQRLWFLHQLEGANSTYNMTAAFEIAGPLDPVALEESLRTIEARHEVLRTTFVQANEQSSQQINPPSFKLARISLNALQAEQQRAAIESLLGEEVLRPFDLVTGPLWRVTLVRLETHQHVLLLTMHHIISDGWSVSVLLHELATAYAASVSGKADSLPELGLQYADFSIWQRAWLRGPRMEEQVAYWKQQLADAPALLNLPTDYPRPMTKGYDGAQFAFPLGLELTQGLNQLVQSEKTTLFITLQAVFALLLARYSGQEDVLVGTPVANRQHTELEPLIGFFANMLVLRNDVADNPPFSDFLQRVHQMALSAYQYQDLPFELLVETLQPERSLSHNPLFQVVFSLHSTLEHTLVLEGTEVKPREIPYPIAKFDLFLRIEETADGLVSWWEYDTALFSAATIERLAGHFQVLLEGFIANPEARVGELPLLSRTERHQHLVAWNDTATDYPQDKCVHQLFEAQVERTPDAIAVQGPRSEIHGQPVTMETQDFLTYRQLNDRANQLAHYLIKTGIGPETLVGICLERSLDMMVAIFGVLKAGGAYIPIDATYPQARIAFMLEDAQVPLLLTSSHIAGGLTIAADAFCMDSEWTWVAGESLENPPCQVRPENLAYCIYTSGSTGKPKGTLVEHRNMLNYLMWAVQAYRVHEGSGAPVNTSISFDATITSIFTPLLVGKKVVLLPEENELEALSHALQSGEDFSLVKLTPTHLDILSQLVEQTIDTRYFVIGGEALLDSHLVPWRTFAPNTHFINEYGPTETVVGCCVYDAKGKTFSSAVPIGRSPGPWGSDRVSGDTSENPAREDIVGAIANTQLYVLDTYQNPVPVGVVGELYIGGAGVARGYLNRPELTAQRFVDNPFEKGNLYKTGDLVRWVSAPDGGFVLEYLGRIDNQVKVRGFRIELGEIESALSGHTAIQEAVVTLREMEPTPSVPEKIQQCVQCGLPSNHPDAKLNADNICNVCLTYDAYKEEAWTYFKTMDAFQIIVDEMKRTRMGKYDCMMLLSGGKDSTYVLAQLVEMGLKVLSFTLDNGFISEEAKANVRKVVDRLGVDHIFGTTPAMNAVFIESLQNFSNVCQGCFKAIYTRSTNIASEHGIKYIVTGLSKGQIFETRLQPIFKEQLFDVEEIDRRIIEARKIYHRIDDVVAREMDVEIFQSDEIFDEVQFVDFYRYSDVTLAEMYEFLEQRVPWVRPSDTGRSTNCLINDVGIYMHKRQRGYHNYALPYSWDVILGHKERDAALEELDDEIDEGRVQDILHEIGYYEQAQKQQRLVAYYVANQEVSASELRDALSVQLPSYMIPAVFMPVEAMPLTPNGKLDRTALPAPDFTPNADTLVLPRTPTERVLTQIWQDVLRVDPIGIQDNFFNLGGDSILSFQIMSRAQQAGVHFTLRQLFQHQTIAELSAVATSMNGLLEAEQGIVTGAVPLTPIQQWFFAQQWAEPHHYNQSFLLAVVSDISPELLRKAVKELLRHHDALRLRFAQQDGVWQQSISAADGLLDGDEAIPFEVIDLAGLPEDEQPLALEQKANELQASFNLAEGPLVRVALFQLETSARLLIVIHHLAVDGVSWRLLFEDLQQIYQQLADDTPIQLPQKTTSYKAWATKLQEEGPALVADELAYWHKIPAAAPLPVDHQRDKNHVASAATISRHLTPAQTQALLTDVVGAYDAQMNDLLLTALAQTWQGWTGEPSLSLHLEGHGREDLFDDVALSRTVGWFTSEFPVYLELPEDDDLAQTVATIQEQLQKIPNRGIGYGILRYLQADTTLAANATPQIGFNYLGQFDQSMQGPLFTGLATESIGSPHSPTGARTHLLDVTCVVAEGKLYMDWTYSHNCHEQATIASLADAFMGALQRIIAHARTMASDTSTAASGWLPLLHNQRALIPPATAIEKAYVNEGSLFAIQTEINAPALQRACQALTARHEALRLRVSQQNGTLVQRVHPEAVVPFEIIDGSNWSQEAVSAHLDLLWRRLFDLEQEPPLRVYLITRAPDEHIFVLLCHHMAVDGWSMQIMLRELPQLYQAQINGQVNGQVNDQSTELPVASWSFTDTLRWQQELLAGAEGETMWRYWQQQLTGKSSALNLPTDYPRPAAISHRGAKYTWSVSDELTQQLHHLAQAQNFPLATVMQAAFHLLLHQLSGQDDILVGMTVNNRVRPELEHVVGSLVDALPLRSTLTGNTTLTDYLGQVRATVLDALAHQGYPSALLAERLPLDNSSGAGELVEPPPSLTQVSFNYNTLRKHQPHTQESNDPNALVLAPCDLPVPLIGNWDEDFIVGISERPDGLGGLVRYNTDIFAEQAIAQMMERYQALLRGIVENPAQSIASLLQT